MRVILLLAFLSFVLVPHASGQSYKTLKAEGDRLFKAKFYNLAVKRYEECFRRKPTDYQVNYKLGIAYLMTNRPEKAEAILNTIYKHKKRLFDDIAYYMAFIKHRQRKFRDAAKLYKEFIGHFPNPIGVNISETRLRNCEVGILQKSKPPIAFIQPLPVPINSEWNELHPIYSPSMGRRKIYFASDREGALGGLRDDFGKVNRKDGHRNPDMFVATTEPALTVKRLSGLLNTSLYDEVMGFSFDGSTMYYKKGYNKYSGLLYEDHFQSTNKDRIAGVLSDLPINMQQGDATPYILMDSIIVFASKREGGYGGYDLYITQKSPSGWSKPRNMGPNINSEYDEICPFLTNNLNGLYYSTNHPDKSMGGFDIVKSVRGAKIKIWSKGQNLGLPVNSPDDDLYFSLSDDGWHFILSSNRIEATGKFDIFEGTFLEPQKDHLVMVNDVEHEADGKIPMDSLSTKMISYQKYPVGTVIPDSLSFVQLDHFIDVAKSAKSKAIILEVYHLSGKLKDYMEKLDPLSTVLVSYLITQTEVPLYISNHLISPDRVDEPGVFVTLSIECPQSACPAGEVPPTGAGVPKATEGLTYKIELANEVQGESPILLARKYDLSFDIWPFEEESKVHTMFGHFLTIETALEWQKELDENGITTRRIVPYIGGKPILSPKDNENYLHRFPELIPLIQQ